jgi:predicted nucleotidyltransferase
VFGSIARGDAHAGSDVDFLVRLEPGRSLLDLGGLQYELQELLGCNVDVAAEDGLRGKTGRRIRREARAL